MSTLRLFQLAKLKAPLSSSSSDECKKTKTQRKQAEKDGWKALLSVCDLSVEDIQVITEKLGYTKIKHLSVLGLHSKNKNNIQPLMDAGISNAKAELVLLFATYVLHANHHNKQATSISIHDDLTFEEVLEFNFLLADPEQVSPVLPVPPTPAPQIIVATPKVAVQVPVASTPAGTSLAPTVNSTPTSTAGEEDQPMGPIMDKGGITFDLPFQLLRQPSDSNLSKASKHSKESKKKRRTKARRNNNNGSGASVCSRSSFKSSASKKSVTWGKDTKKQKARAERIPSNNGKPLKESRWSSTSLDDIPASIASAETTTSLQTKIRLRRVRSDGSVNRPFRRPSVEVGSGEEAAVAAGNAVWTSQSQKTTANSRRTKKVKAGNEHTTKALLLEPSAIMNTSSSSFPGLSMHKASTHSTNDGQPQHEKAGSNALKKRNSSASLPGLPMRRASLILPVEPPRKQHKPAVMTPAAQSTLRWAMALDVDEDLTDWSDSDDDDDNDSDSDSDDDDDDDDDDDSESSDEDSDEEDEDDEGEFLDHTTMDVSKEAKQQHKQKHCKKTAVAAGSEEPRVFRWKTSNVTTHEWTLPANQVLPVSLQTLFREAAHNPEIDIQQQLQMALALAANEGA